MAPYLDTVKSFEDAITDAGVNTLDFLQACEGLIGLLNVVGPVTFLFVIKDMQENIKKVQGRYNAAPTESATLESLITNEKKAFKGTKKEALPTATEGLLWLLRGLAFTCKALQNAQEAKSKQLVDAFTESYAQTLKPFHNKIFVQPVVVVALMACPTRQSFFSELMKDPAGGSPATPEKLDEALDRWLGGLHATVQRLTGFYVEQGIHVFKSS